MYENNVYCTNIRVYYGREVASARINIHETDIDKVEDPMFWPEEIICRKWQTKSEWDAELEKRYRERQQMKRNRQYRHQYQSRDNHDYDDNEDYYNRNGDYDKNEEVEREKSGNWWHSWGKTNSNKVTYDVQTYRF